MKKLLPCTALVMCAGMACAQAEERNDWHFNIGAMYEIENVEGYGEDMDGLAEPSVYFNAANGPWIAGVTGTGRMISNVKAMILTVWVYFTVMISRMVFPFRWNTRLSGRITTKATAINSIMQVSA